MCFQVQRSQRTTGEIFIVRLNAMKNFLNWLIVCLSNMIYIFAWKTTGIYFGVTSYKNHFSFVLRSIFLLCGSFFCYLFLLYHEREPCFDFVVCNPCQSSPFLTILVPCGLLLSLQCFSFIANCYFQVYFSLKVILYWTKINQNARTLLVSFAAVIIVVTLVGRSVA